MAKIFLTGVTGFLGSNIARVLIKNGHELVATCRSNSPKQLCVDFEDKVIWVEQRDDWEAAIIAANPQIIIHGAWIGVTHAERNNWDAQYQNVDYLCRVLNIGQKAGVKKIIALGSQAEYGAFNGMVTEDHPLNPTEAYGRVKVICSELLRQYATHFQIDWYWLRLFAFFGIGEAESWLIPTLVKKMLTESHMDLTPGEQKSAYLYADDLGLAINNIVIKKGLSGMYNISGKNLLTLKNLVEDIRDKVNSTFLLNFGAIAYRPNQTMHMQGDTSAFVNQFGQFDISDFDSALADTIAHLKQRFSI